MEGGALRPHGAWGHQERPSGFGPTEANEGRLAHSDRTLPPKARNSRVASRVPDKLLFNSYNLLTYPPYGVGRGCGVGRGLGVTLGVGVGVTVGVGVGVVGVGVGVGVPGVGVGVGVPGVGVGVGEAHGGIS
jgi:hypothetical protein